MYPSQCHSYEFFKSLTMNKRIQDDNVTVHCRVSITTKKISYYQLELAPNKNTRTIFLLQNIALFVSYSHIFRLYFVPSSVKLDTTLKQNGSVKAGD